MEHRLATNTTEFKIDDSNTPIEFFPSDDGRSLNLDNATEELSVMKD